MLMAAGLHTLQPVPVTAKVLKHRHTGNNNQMMQAYRCWSLCGP